MNTITAEITYYGETRTVQVEQMDNGQLWTDCFVATIGSGTAKYPTAIAFRPLPEGKKAPRFGLSAVTQDGQRYTASTSTVVRNRTAQISGWNNEATNTGDQRRV